MATTEQIYELTQELLKLNLDLHWTEIRVYMDGREERPFKVTYLPEGTHVYLTFDQMKYWKETYLALGWFFRGEPLPVLNDVTTNLACAYLLNDYQGSPAEARAVLGEFYVD